MIARWFAGAATSPYTWAVVAALLALVVGVTSISVAVLRVRSDAMGARDAQWRGTLSAAEEKAREQASALTRKSAEAAEAARGQAESVEAAQVRIRDLERTISALRDDPVLPEAVVKELRR